MQWGSSFKTPNPDLAVPASLTQNMREDDPRRYYPPITPESMASDTPPPAPGKISVDETSYEARPGPGEDQAAAMAARAVEGKGVKYPSTSNDESDANATAPDTRGQFPSYQDVPSSGNVDPAEAAVAAKLEQGDTGNEMEADATDYLAGQGSMTPEKFQRKYGRDLHEFLRAGMGIPEEEMPQEAIPYDPNQMLRNATEGRRK
jgi:hypothetical protein